MHYSSFLKYITTYPYVIKKGDFLLGCIYYCLGDNINAKVALEKSILHFHEKHDTKDHALALMYLGSIYRDCGQFYQAELFLKKAYLYTKTPLALIPHCTPSTTSL